MLWFLPVRMHCTMGLFSAMRNVLSNGCCYEIAILFSSCDDRFYLVVICFGGSCGGTPDATDHRVRRRPTRPDRNSRPPQRYRHYEMQRDRRRGGGSGRENVAYLTVLKLSFALILYTSIHYLELFTLISWPGLIYSFLPLI